jgi:outer membrane protein OmpA-like peptidoglycan-associated protein
LVCGITNKKEEIKSMKHGAFAQLNLPSQLAVIALASAISIPAVAQQSAGQPQSTPPSATQQPSPEAPSSATTSNAPQKEGFWGRMNPFARKKWVHRQIDPLKDRLNELDELNAKNARDIKDVDERAQAGIRKAQTTADAANQTATAAGQQAQQANTTAMAASTHVDTINGTVNGLDQYKQVNVLEIPFRGGQPILSKDAKDQLDQLAANLTGKQGYILEISGHAPGAGSVGIQNSEKLTESIKRYLVTEHQIPVFRMHAVAMGNAVDQANATDDNGKPVRIRTSSVSIRLMENSLAAQGTNPPQGQASSN